MEKEPLWRGPLKEEEYSEEKQDEHMAEITVWEFFNQFCFIASAGYLGKIA